MSGLLVTGTSSYQIVVTDDGQALYVKSNNAGTGTNYKSFIQYCTSSSGTWSCNAFVISSSGTSLSKVQAIALDKSSPQNLFVINNKIIYKCGSTTNSACTSVTAINTATGNNAKVIAFDSANILYAGSVLNNTPVGYKCASPYTSCTTFTIPNSGSSSFIYTMSFNPRFVFNNHYHHHHHHHYYYHYYPHYHHYHYHVFITIAIIIIIYYQHYPHYHHHHRH